MATVAHALTTLDKVKLLLGITGTAQDVLLEGLINAATDFIETFCSRRFIKPASAIEELIDGNGSKTLTVRNFPIIDLTKLEIRVDATTFEEINSDAYYIDGKTGLIILDSKTTEGISNYRATYIGGYTNLAAVPNDLQQACAELVVREYNQRQGGGDIESERIGEYSITYGQGGAEGSESDKFIDGTLARYKSINI